MIRAEHFIYALYNDYGIRIKQSPNVEKLLSEQSLKQLHSLKVRKKERIEFLWFPDEQVITASFLKQVQDKHGRKGSYNHTIMLRLEDYFKLAPPSQYLEVHFIKNQDVPPDTLEPLEIKP